MSELSKKSEKKVVSPINQAEVSCPGPGRPKGSKNKFTNLKESFLEAFEENARRYILLLP